MRVLLLGGTGQVGEEIRALAPQKAIDIVAPTHGEVDLQDAAAIARIVASASWGAVINAAAYTDVDRAESEQGAIVDVPFHGRKKARLERMPGYPAKLCVQLRKIDCVAKIVPRTIEHESDQLPMHRAVLSRRETIHRITDCVDNIDITTLGVPTDIVGFPDPSSFQHER